MVLSVLRCKKARQGIILCLYIPHRRAEDYCRHKASPGGEVPPQEVEGCKAAVLTPQSAALTAPLKGSLS